MSLAWNVISQPYWCKVVYELSRMLSEVNAG